MDEKLLPISFVAEYVYCPRSCFWKITGHAPIGDENIFIADGNAAHRKVDAGYVRSRGVKEARSSVRVVSENLGISGVVDVVEFYEDGRIVPVEFKRGKIRESEMHEAQIALAALCLKEMFPDAIVTEGAVFFTGDRRRKKILLDENLLEKARVVAHSVKEKMRKGLIPSNFPAEKDKRCTGCCFHVTAHTPPPQKPPLPAGASFFFSNLYLFKPFLLYLSLGYRHEKSFPHPFSKAREARKREC